MTMNVPGSIVKPEGAAAVSGSVTVTTSAAPPLTVASCSVILRITHNALPVDIVSVPKDQV